MVNVSKNPLDPKMTQKLFRQFAALFSGAQRNTIEVLFTELFTEAERVLYIKRLAAILMCAEGCTPYTIAQTLHMSSTTVALIADQYELGHFDGIVRRAGKSSFDSKAFWNTLEVLLRGGLPPRTKDRWKYVPGMGG